MKIIAAQAAAVAALVIVAYAVLLRPEATNDIRGIEAPEGALPPTRIEAKDDRGGGRDRPDRRRRDTRGAAGAAGAVGGSTAVGDVSLPTGAAGTLPASPVTDQYADAAELLLKRVRGGSLPGE